MTSTRKCKIEGCDRFVAAWDLCAKHYYSARRAGTIVTGSKCSVEACDRKAMVRGLCNGHYKRLLDHGHEGTSALVLQIRGRKCGFEGCERRHHKGGFCQVHSQHLEKHGSPRPVRKMAKFGEGSVKGGYRLIYRPNHPNCQPSNGLIAEHRFVMSESLGRPLLTSEEVHHKNGDKLDNRLVKGHEIRCPGTCCNLELWTTSQPPGQRIADKLAWCHEFIRQYEAAI